MTIIKVTGASDGRAVFVNMDTVETFCIGTDRHSEDTAIFFEHNDFPVYVKEKPEQIIDAIRSNSLLYPVWGMEES